MTKDIKSFNIWSFSTEFGAKIPRAHLRIVEVGCVCGTEFCLDCNEAPHWPASCQQIKAYTKALDIQNGECWVRFKIKILIGPDIYVLMKVGVILIVLESGC